MANGGNGGDRGASPGRRLGTGAIVAITVAVLVVLIGGGYLLAKAMSGSDEPSPSVTPSATKTASPTETPTPTETPSPTETPTPTTSPKPALRSGWHHAYVRSANGGPSPAIVVDVVEFYTGAEADEKAAENGDGPLASGFYIVPSGPNGVRVPVSPGVLVRYLPTMGGPAREGTWERFVRRSKGATVPGDWPEIASALWRIKVAAGVVTRIEQEYLP